MLASAKKVSYHGYQPTEAKYVSSQKCSLVQSEERDYTETTALMPNCVLTCNKEKKLMCVCVFMYQRERVRK